MSQVKINLGRKWFVLFDAQHHLNFTPQNSLNQSKIILMSSVKVGFFYDSEKATAPGTLVALVEEKYLFVVGILF